LTPYRGTDGCMRRRDNPILLNHSHEATMS
jgi:hypothetical protein